MVFQKSQQPAAAAQTLFSRQRREVPTCEALIYLDLGLCLGEPLEAGVRVHGRKAAVCDHLAALGLAAAAAAAAALPAHSRARVCRNSLNICLSVLHKQRGAWSSGCRRSGPAAHCRSKARAAKHSRRTSAVG